MHLPLIDFRAYKEGVNIQEGMSIPEDAPETLYNYNWTFRVNGEDTVVTTTGAYPQVAGDFIGVETTLINEGYVPPIHDFSMEKNGEDHTSELLQENKLIMIIAYSLRRSEAAGLKKLHDVIREAKSKGYRVIGLSASGDALKSKVNKEYDLDLEWFFSDETALKTIIRSNPGIVKLKKGTILQKLHWNDSEDLEL